MSNRFHNKFHRHNHHTAPTDSGGLYPDSAYDPIASKESPFRGDFYLSGNFIGFQNCYISQNLSADNVLCNNLTVIGQTTQLDTFVYATSAVTITNTGTYTGLTVVQDGLHPIAHFIDNDGDNHIIFDEDGNVGIGTTSPGYKLDIKGKETVPVGPGIGMSQLKLSNSAGVNPPSIRMGVSMYSGDYNPIVQHGDQAIIFSGSTINSLSSNLVIAPHYNSVGGIRITHEGNVGIGVATPRTGVGRVLHVSNNSTNVTRTVYDPRGYWSSPSQTQLYVESLNSTAAVRLKSPDGSSIQFCDANPNETYIGAIGVSTVEGSMGFATGGNSLSSYTTRMVITSSGFVGIGTSNPRSLLHLNRSSASDGTPLSSVGFRITNSIQHQGAHSFIQLGNGTSGYAMFWEPIVNKLRFNYDENIGNASTRIMTMLSSGDVGIGTTDPNARLTVVGNVSATGKMVLGDASPAFFEHNETLIVSQSATQTPSRGGLRGITINNSCNTAEALIGIKFLAADDGNTSRHGASIVSGKEKNWVFESLDYPGYLSFWTRQGNNPDQFERMRINSSGDVGIGTSTPSAKLDVAGQVKGTAAVGALVANSANTEQTSILLTRQGAPDDKKSWEIAHLNSDSNGKFIIRSINGDYTQEDVAIAAWKNPYDWGINQLTFGTNFSTRMVIASSGYVGIGTQNPNTTLDVNGNATITGTTTINGDVTFGRSIYAGKLVSTDDASLELGYERTGEGNAYIDLHAVPGTDYDARFIRVGGANGNATLINRGIGDFNIFQQDLGSIVIGTANTERMRITSSGSVGIGTAVPNEVLTVVGNIESYGSSVNSTIIRARSVNNNAVLQLDNLYSSSGSGPLINFQFGSKSFARIKTNVSLSALGFETDDVERIRVTKDGKVGIGTTTPNAALTVVGQISATEEISTFGGNSSNWSSTYTTVRENSAIWTGTELVGRTVQVPIQGCTILNPNYTDIELVPNGATETAEISAFTSGLRGITYTITNKTGYKVVIFGSSNLIIRRGNSWRSNTSSMSGAFLTLPIGGSCSLRADSNTTFSAW